MSVSLPRIEPAIPTLVDPFHRSGWVYEEKIDGWRIIAYKHGDDVRLVSRTGRDHTARFGDIARAIGKLSPRTLILDGEVAVFDERLVSRFDLLGESAPTEVVTPPIFMAFDCLYRDGRDLRSLPLGERRLFLERVVGGDTTSAEDYSTPVGDTADGIRVTYGDASRGRRPRAPLRRQKDTF